MHNMKESPACALLSLPVMLIQPVYIYNIVDCIQPTFITRSYTVTRIAQSKEW